MGEHADVTARDFLELAKVMLEEARRAAETGNTEIADRVLATTERAIDFARGFLAKEIEETQR